MKYQHPTTLILPGTIRRCVAYVDNSLARDIAFQEKESDTLVITFAGMAGILRTVARIKRKLGLATRPFEFAHTLHEMPCDAVFLRDRYRAYYHSGVKGVGYNIEEVSEFLKHFIKEREYKTVVTLGHSMGAHASLIFASRIGANISIAISPPTFLDSQTRSKHGDERYDYEKKRLCRDHPGSAYLDLRDYFLSFNHMNLASSCTYCIFYGENDRLDGIHAKRMKGLGQRVELFEVKGSGHNAARAIRDSGLLSVMLNQILNSRYHGDVDDLIDLIRADASISGQELQSHA